MLLFFNFFTLTIIRNYQKGADMRSYCLINLKKGKNVQSEIIISQGTIGDNFNKMDLKLHKLTETSKLLENFQISLLLLLKLLMLFG
jgi:hypothetical protein